MRRELGERHREGTTLDRLGDSHHDAGNATEARAAWRLALDILTTLDHPNAAHVRAKLDPPHVAVSPEPMIATGGRGLDRP